MKIFSRKTEKRVLAGIGSVLFLLCVGLWLGTVLVPGAEPVVENQKAVLYDAARIPPLPPGGDININLADADTLDTLPGIGTVLAERIVAHRAENGAFVHPASIMEVEGIGEKTYAEIADKICVK